MSPPPSVSFRFATACAVLAAVALYARSLDFAIVYDSLAILRGDTRLHEPTWDNLARIFTEGYWYPQQIADLYRPLTTLSFLANMTLHGEWAAGFRAVNLLLHVVAVVLIGTLIRRAAGEQASGRIGALAGMALFAVHPIGVEGVVNLVGRADALVAVALLGVGLLAWDGPPAGRRGVALLLLGLAAVLSKEHGVMACAVALWIAWVRRPPARVEMRSERARAAVRWALREVWPYVPALVVFAVVRLHFGKYAAIPGQVFVDNPITGAPRWIEGWMTAWRVFAAYLSVLVLPLRLSADDSFAAETVWSWDPASWGTWQALVGLVAGAGLVVAAVVKRRSWPAVSIGIGWFLLVLLPTSNLVVPIGSIRAERFLYAPGVGLAWLFGVAVAASWTRPAVVRVVLAAVLSWVVLLAVRTHVRLDDWRDSYAFWAAVHREAPESFRGLRGLARAEADRDPGEAGLRRAIELGRAAVAVLERPGVAPFQRDPWAYYDLARYELGLAELLEREGRPDASLDAAAQRSVYGGIAVEEALAAEAARHFGGRTFPADDRGTTPDVTRYLVMGRLLHRRGEYEAAVRELEIGLRRNPLEPHVARFRAEALERAGRREDAVGATLRAILLEPQDPRNLDLLARLLSEDPERATSLRRGPYGYYLDMRASWLRQALLGALADLEEDLRTRGLASRAAEQRRRFAHTFGLSF